MGCFASTPSDAGGNRRRVKSIGELAVFVPGFRIPIGVDFTEPLGDSLPKSLVNRLSALRTRIVAMAMHEATTAIKSKQKMITRNGTSTFSDLLQALEDYLPVLLGLTKDGSQLKDKVPFVWINQEDDDEQTTIGNVWYEVLSVLHLMATLCLAEANYLLLPRKSKDGYQQRVSEGSIPNQTFSHQILYITSLELLHTMNLLNADIRKLCDEDFRLCILFTKKVINSEQKNVAENRRRSIDVLLKAAGYLDCSIRHVLPQIPLELRRNLPVDLSEEELHALCMQALGQGVDIQLEMAIDSPKATLAVKRRLACEMVKYWHQDHSQRTTEVGKIVAG
ncbi:hypothetical protein M5K25_016740 [Dendrobium thyrsiflorum]|uniref:BRO1 domain-containing protein n=1 Tax=Dendrobium thyrsiflorum TaxID=117978 RepID=A0ABD0UKF5_DENTH